MARLFLDLRPDVTFVPDLWATVDRPAAKAKRALNQLFALHELEPHAVVSGQDKLRVWKFLLQERANLTTMAGVDRHQHIVEDGKRKSVAERVLHQCKIEAKPHAILMALAVVGPGRKSASSVKVDIEGQSAQ